MPKLIYNSFEDQIIERDLENFFESIARNMESFSRRPDDGIRNVYFNEAKRTTVVCWKDGTKTIVKCQPGDTFSKETGLALCYMKKAFDNRSCFNETLKKYCYGEDE